MAKEKLTYEKILQQLKLRQFAPIYVLMGEETYYIDKITDYIEQHVLSKEEKELNLTTHYGKDVSADAVISDTLRYPMMSPYQVVFLKEAQTMDKRELNKLDLLDGFLNNPPPHTIFVIAYKYGKFDKRKKWLKLAAKQGVVFESEKLRDYQMDPEVQACAKRAGLKIDPRSISLLVEFVGTDLSQMESVIEKLRILIGKGGSITPELIEKNIGISKDYTSFELVNALAKRDVLRSNRIIQNSSAVIQQHTMTLFNFFSNLMIFHYLDDKSKGNVAKELRINPYFVQEYQNAARHYGKMKTFTIIDYIREYDGKSKGVQNVSTGGLDLMKELIYKILH